MILFHDPWVFLLLGLVPLWWWARNRFLRPPALDFSSTLPAASVAGRGRARFTRIFPAMKVAGLCLVVAALARPQWEEEGLAQHRAGIDILLLVDVSSSMAEHLMDEERSNLDLAREVVGEFARVRRDDRLGLISFARFPRLECPLTTDPEAVAGFAAGLESMPRESERDGTAIGAALAEAAQRLGGRAQQDRERGAARAPGAAGRQGEVEKGETRDQVAVLITDGEENQYKIDPMTAACLLRSMGVKVYTVAASGRVAASSGQDSSEPAARAPNFQLHESIAKVTGGEFAQVSNGSDLKGVMDRIDGLEKRPVESRLHTARIDLFRWLLLPAVLLALLEFFLSRTLFMRTP